MKIPIDRIEIEHRHDDRWIVTFFRECDVRSYPFTFTRLMLVKRILNTTGWKIDSVWFGTFGLLVDFRYD